MHSSLGDLTIAFLLYYEDGGGCSKMACLVSLLQCRHDHVVGDLAGKTQETNITNVSPSTQLTLGWITACVSVAVSHAANAPDHTQDRGCNGVTKPRDDQREQEGRVTLQCVLVDALLAVEDHLLLVLLSLSFIGVHLREWDASRLAVGTDLVAKDCDEDSREDGDGESLNMERERERKTCKYQYVCVHQFN